MGRIQNAGSSVTSEDTLVFPQSDQMRGHILHPDYSCSMCAMRSLTDLPPACPKYCQKYRSWVCTFGYFYWEEECSLRRRALRDTLRELLHLFYHSFFFQSIGEIGNLSEFCLSPEVSKNPQVLLYILYKSNPDHSPHTVFKLFSRHPIISENFIQMVLSDLMPSAHVSILSDCYSQWKELMT